MTSLYDRLEDNIPTNARRAKRCQIFSQKQTFPRHEVQGKEGVVPHQI